MERKAGGKFWAEKKAWGQGLSDTRPEGRVLDTMPAWEAVCFFSQGGGACLGADEEFRLFQGKAPRSLETDADLGPGEKGETKLLAGPSLGEEGSEIGRAIHPIDSSQGEKVFFPGEFHEEGGPSGCFPGPEFESSVLPGSNPVFLSVQMDPEGEIA